MESRQLSLGDYPLLQEFLAQAYLPAPFFSSLKESYRCVFSALFTSQAVVFGYFNKKRLVAALVGKLQGDSLTVENILFHRQEAFPSGALQAQLFKSLRQVLKTTLRWPQNCLVPTWTTFFATGKLQENFYQWDVVTKTALILGGGGARGAYQIGIYQALREHHVPFQFVAGTSVGALNGGLILQGELEKALALWQEIDTQQILAFAEDVTPDNLTRGRFVREALLSAGLSTAPLQQLITQYMDSHKIQQATQEFQVVTTEVPTLKETVIKMHEASLAEFMPWLVASASFFPAMALAKIDDHYYMDGGYRNNLPQNLGLAWGADLLITIDVKGPGFIKNTRLPATTAEIFCKSPWSLGEVLLFEKNRSQQNLVLGYLDGLKIFQAACGYWYTLDSGALWTQYQLGQTFLRQQPQWRLAFKHGTVFSELGRFYQQPVSQLNFSLALMELLAAYFNIQPTELYAWSELQAAVVAASKEKLTQGQLSRTDLLAVLGQRAFGRLLSNEGQPFFAKGALSLLQAFLTFITQQ